MAAKSVFIGRTSANGTYSIRSIITHLCAPLPEEGEKNMLNHGNLAENIDIAKDHVLFHHNPADTKGWITLAKKDPQTHRFYQYHYKPSELVEHLSQWTGEDIYLSQNTFFKPQRRIDSILQLRTLYVDLDVYNLNLKPEWVLGKLEFEYFGQVIPEPSMVIFSGRGLVLVWNIEPIPYMAMPLWRAVENFFAKALKDVGADEKATDPARIFRLAGTVNSKSNSMVKVQYRHAYRYDIHELQYDYLPELTPKAPKAKNTPGRKSKIVRLFNIYSLHLSRARDLGKLVELRNGDVRNYREYICFLYRYFTCCYTNDPARAMEEMLDLNSEFIDPLPEREVIRATKSAQKAWEAKSDAKANEVAKSMGYPGAGYNLKNSKIIDWLDITPEEQKEMSTLIGPKEKRRRNLILKESQRRQEGIRPMEEYNQERKAKVNSKAEVLKQLMTENPTWSNVKLAEAMDISEGYIRKLKKTIE